MPRKSKLAVVQKAPVAPTPDPDPNLDCAFHGLDDVRSALERRLQASSPAVRAALLPAVAHIGAAITLVGVAGTMLEQGE